jgi:hypothetical protein
MGDDRLRDLERRAKQLQPGARAALLTERLRTGELTRERLELAAYAGDADARAIGFGPSAAAAPADWFRGFYRWGKATRVRAGLAACASIDVEPRLADLGNGRRMGAPNTARASLAAVQAWLECPCDRHETACYWAGDEAGCDFPRAQRVDPPWGAFACAASSLAYLTSETEPPPENGYLRRSSAELDIASAVVPIDDLVAAITLAVSSRALEGRLRTAD